ncbi:hypothetical protein B0H11DRAFT_2075333 [Mycena galericulata]|nr:hypothetical protein B0H11DRAFT_2075333 [Mycena galericulata]
MSCSICRLPFIPDLARATSPLPEHTPPQSVVPKDQATYYMSCVGVGRKIMGCVQRLHYYSSNMFGSMTGFEVLTWESAGGTFFMAHHVCLSLLRCALNLEDDTMLSTTTLCAHELILGRPQDGAKAGRFKAVNYEDVGEKVDLSPFWKPGREAGCNVFDWKALKSDKKRALDWLIQRPDIFPRFSRTVSTERLGLIGVPLAECARADRITTMPLELILHLLPHLSLNSYITLTSTCRFLRFHALTTFQSHARIKPKFRAEMAGTDDALREGDWFLYLSQVHWTRSMRVRRWIWALCEEIARVWMKNLPNSSFADVGKGVKSVARIRLEKEVEDKVKEVGIMRALNERARADAAR